MKRFDGDYVTAHLYMSRSDVVETLALIKRKGYDLREMSREADELNALRKDDNHDNG